MLLALRFQRGVALVEEEFVPHPKLRRHGLCQFFGGFAGE